MYNMLMINYFYPLSSSIPDYLSEMFTISRTKKDTSEIACFLYRYLLIIYITTDTTFFRWHVSRLLCRVIGTIS
jgi:hypothetical protein